MQSEVKKGILGYGLRGYIFQKTLSNHNQKYLPKVSSSLYSATVYTTN